jgi:hypothetical protein
MEKEALRAKQRKVDYAFFLFSFSGFVRRARAKKRM